MKVAITADGNDLASNVDPRFGRAKWFLVVDTESGEIQKIDNAQNYNAPQGAGIQSAQNVINAGAEAVITGNTGPNAFRVLSEGGVKVYLAKEGTVGDAIEALKKGDLKPIDEANVEGHWV